MGILSFGAMIRPPVLVARRWSITLVMVPLALAGCQTAHTINSEDARYCELQGFPPGTDRNADCAARREAERGPEDSAREPAERTVAAPVDRPTPPPHAGGVSQTIPLTATAGTAITIVFAVSLKPDCGVDSLPVLRVGKQPAHGRLEVVHREDYARLSRNSFPIACADTKVPGVSLDYTPNFDYAGVDFIEFETVMKSGNNTVFRVPIKVRKKPPAGDAY